MKHAKFALVGTCAFLAMAAAGCGGGGSGASSSPPPASTVSVKVSPTSATVGFGGTQQFTATVSGTSDSDTAVTWTVTDNSGGTNKVGTINSSGLYTAPPAASPSAQTSTQTLSVTAGQTASSVNVTVPQLNPNDSVTVTATSQADTSQSASATVTFSGLSIAAVGLCDQSGSCSGGATGAQVSQGQTVTLFIAGYGIVPGTEYYISGDDVTPNSTLPIQPPNSDFRTTSDGTPAVAFQVAVSPTAALGPRNIVVTNLGGELSAFPGGLKIVQ